MFKYNTYLNMLVSYTVQFRRPSGLNDWKDNTFSKYIKNKIWKTRITYRKVRNTKVLILNTLPLLQAFYKEVTSLSINLVSVRIPSLLWTVVECCVFLSNIFSILHCLTFIYTPEHTCKLNSHLLRTPF